MVAVTLLYRKGYFRQLLEPSGQQPESAEQWNPAERLKPLTNTACVSLEGRAVQIRAWSYEVRGITEQSVPVYLLDTDVPGK